MAFHLKYVNMFDSWAEAGSKNWSFVNIYGDMFDWVCDCLNERKQHGVVNRKSLLVGRIEFGVLQESLLGPNVFLVCVINHQSLMVF